MAWPRGGISYAGTIRGRGLPSRGRIELRDQREGSPRGADGVDERQPLGGWGRKEAGARRIVAGLFITAHGLLDMAGTGAARDLGRIAAGHARGGADCAVTQRQHRCRQQGDHVMRYMSQS